MTKIPWWHRWRWLLLLSWAAYWCAFQVSFFTLHLSAAPGLPLANRLEEVKIWGALLFRTPFAFINFVLMGGLVILLQGTLCKGPATRRWLAVFMATCLWCGLKLKSDWLTPQTSQNEFTRQFGMPVPAGAVNYRGWHPHDGFLETAFAGDWGIYRMEMSPAEMEHLLQQEKSELIAPEREDWLWTMLSNTKLMRKILKGGDYTVYKLTSERHGRMASRTYLAASPSDEVVIFVAHTFPK